MSDSGDRDRDRVDQLARRAGRPRRRRRRCRCPAGRRASRSRRGRPASWRGRCPTAAASRPRPAISPASTARCDQPTVAISGAVKTLEETLRRSSGVTASPRKCHIAIRPCIAATEASISTPVQSPAAYTPRAEVRETRSTWMKPPSSSDHARLLQAEVGGVGDRAEREDAVRALDGAAVGERHRDHVAVAGHRLHPGLATAPSSRGGSSTSSSTCGGVGVLAGQHPVAGGDQGDRDAEGEVRAANSAPVTPEPTTTRLVGHLGEVVDLLPGQDPLAVGLGGRAACAARRRWRAARRPPRAVSLAAVGRGRRRPGRARRAGRARGRRATPSRSSRRAMSADWSAASCLTRALTRARSTDSVGGGVALVVGEARPRARRRRPCSVISSAVAIRVLLGTQSVSTAEPPRPSVSTTVTSAPSWAATSAAS